jgi:hypothetical protein
VTRDGSVALVRIFRDATGSTCRPVSTNVTEAVKDSGVLVAIDVVLLRLASLAGSSQKNSN